MSKKLYGNITELEKAITKYLKEQKKPTPRHFRAIGLGISKSCLSNWKHDKTRVEHLNLIKDTEDYIMAMLEQKFTFGGKEAFNISYTLRAYDNARYNPNYENRIDNDTITEPIQIVLGSNVKEKGIQSGREIKLISSSK